MNIKRLIGRGCVGGGRIIEKHITDALTNKERTGRPFNECLQKSVDESSLNKMKSPLPQKSK